MTPKTFLLAIAALVALLSAAVVSVPSGHETALRMVPFSTHADHAVGPNPRRPH